MSSIKDIQIMYQDKLANDLFDADYEDLTLIQKQIVDDGVTEMVDIEIAHMVEQQFPHFKDDIFDHYKVKLEDEVLNESTAS